MTKRIPALAVLRRHDFALLWSGQLISNLGNWVFWIAPLSMCAKERDRLWRPVCCPPSRNCLPLGLFSAPFKPNRKQSHATNG